MFTRKSIIKKTIEVGSSTFLSRCLGIAREILMLRYMGATALSDAFVTAWKVPNSLRKIFAEGALSAALVPTVVKEIRKNGRDAIGGLMALGFLIFEGVVLLLSAAIIFKAQFFIALIAPGFNEQQIEFGAKYLSILMPFIFLISTSALLAGPLQAVGHFFIPAFGPVLLNLFFIVGLFHCLLYSAPITVLCWYILAGGIVQLLAHVAIYVRLRFGFGSIQRDDVQKMMGVLWRFIPCAVSMSVMEIGLFIDTSFASLLSKGTVTLIKYANRFMGIPLGVFGVALSTTLLPHFYRVSTYAPKRLGFMLLESSKLIWWIIAPVMFAMALLSQKIFTTLFVTDKFSFFQAQETGNILVACLIGLFFFSINKIISNVFYAFHYTAFPAIVAVFSVGLNILLNWLWIDSYGAVGLALATTIAAIAQTVFLYAGLHYLLEVKLYLKQLIAFVSKSMVQHIVIGPLFIAAYWALYYLFEATGFTMVLTWLWYWMWVGPLCALYMITLYASRDHFGLKIFFLEGD